MDSHPDTFSAERLRVIPWPHVHPSPRNSWWVVQDGPHGYTPRFGPYRLKDQAEARLERYRREQGSRMP
jgi:hypothetical protein